MLLFFSYWRKIRIFELSTSQNYSQTVERHFIIKCGVPGEAEDRATRPQILTRVSEVSLEVVKISAEAILGPTSPEEAPPEAVPSEAETDHLARRLVVSLTLILMLKESYFLSPCRAKAFYSLALIAFLIAFKIITLI